MRPGIPAPTLPATMPATSAECVRAINDNYTCTKVQPAKSYSDYVATHRANASEEQDTESRRRARTYSTSGIASRTWHREWTTNDSKSQPPFFTNAADRSVN